MPEADEIEDPFADDEWEPEGPATCDCACGCDTPTARSGETCARCETDCWAYDPAYEGVVFIGRMKGDDDAAIPA